MSEGSAARVGQVVPDPGVSGVYVALIEPGSSLEFANPVPFNGPEGPIEQGVEASGPNIVSNGIALSGTAHSMFDRG